MFQWVLILWFGRPRDIITNVIDLQLFLSLSFILLIYFLIKCNSVKKGIWKYFTQSSAWSFIELSKHQPFLLPFAIKKWIGDWHGKLAQVSSQKNISLFFLVLYQISDLRLVLWCFHYFILIQLGFSSWFSFPLASVLIIGWERLCPGILGIKSLRSCPTIPHICVAPHLFNTIKSPTKTQSQPRNTWPVQLPRCNLCFFASWSW